MTNRVQNSIFVSLIAALILLTGCVGSFNRLVEQGDVFRGQKRYEEALTAYKAVVDRYPNDPRIIPVVVKMAELESMVFTRPEKSLQLYDEMIARWPLEGASVDAYKGKGLLLMGEERYQEAIEVFSIVTKHFSSHPNWVWFQHQIALCYIKLRDFRQARVELEKALDGIKDGDARLAQVAFDYAETFFYDGKYGQAAIIYQKVSVAFPQSDYGTLSKLMMLECYTELHDTANASRLEKELRETPIMNDPALRERLDQLTERLRRTGNRSKLPWE